MHAPLLKSGALHCELKKKWKIITNPGKNVQIKSDQSRSILMKILIQFDKS